MMMVTMALMLIMLMCCGGRSDEWYDKCDECGYENSVDGMMRQREISSISIYGIRYVSVMCYDIECRYLLCYPLCYFSYGAVLGARSVGADGGDKGVKK